MVISIFPNVIFPAFTAPYVSAFLFPIAGGAALLSEMGVYRRLNKAASGIGIVTLVVGSNLVSWIIGIILGSFLPTGLIRKEINTVENKLSMLTTGPNFMSLALMGFILALFISILFEYPIIKLFAKRARISNPWKTVAYANICSYSVLLIITVFWVYVIW